MLEMKQTNKQKKTPNHLYWSARAAVTNHQKLDGLDNRTWVSQGAGGVGKLGVSGCFQGEERICSGLSPWLVDGMNTRRHGSLGTIFWALFPISLPFA